MAATKLLTVLNQLGRELTSELDMTVLVNKIVEHAVGLTNAQFAAFFYYAPGQDGTVLELEAIAGARPSDFGNVGRPSATKLLASHLDTGVTRVDDVLTDPRFGKGRYKGLPPSHIPVRSYMALPVMSRDDDDRFGSILLGHSEPGKFTDLDQQIVIGLAALASISMNNATLFAEAQRELQDRREAELALRSALDRQKLLLDELNHRVKNTLATIQSIAIQTKNSVAVKHDDPTVDQFYEAFEPRLLSLSRAHDLLVKGAWTGVGLDEAIRAAIAPVIVNQNRVSIAGPEIILSPNAVVTMAMAFHELATNALKYGALAADEGTIRIMWTTDGKTVEMTWKERGGPKISEPLSSGFGTRLIERGAMRELGGLAKLHYDRNGLRCVMTVPVSSKVSVVV